MPDRTSQDHASGELNILRAELEHYRNEKQKIREAIGDIGGRGNRRRETMVNITFLVLVVGFFVFDVVRTALQLDVPYLPETVVLEIAVLLVSIKIIWMIHTQTKVDHFQFWILNSIEFQITQLGRRTTEMRERLDAALPQTPEPANSTSAASSEPDK